MGGCPVPPGTTESVLTGDWITTLQDGSVIVATFNGRDDLTHIAAHTAEGAHIERTVAQATTTIDGSNVTVRVVFAPFEVVTFSGTLSEDEQTLTGTLSSGITFGSPIAATLEGEIVFIRPPDCDGSSVPDYLEIAAGAVADCNGNGVPDACDIAAGDETDLDADGVPDACSGG
jgi:hypothetical protein